MTVRRAAVAALVLPLLVAGAACAGSERATVRAGGDWTRFGYDAARRDAGPRRTGITSANVKRLKRKRVAVPGSVDSSPIYLRAVRVKGGRHDTFFVTTSYGKAIAIDASSAKILWTFTPRGYGGWAGSDRITNSSPVADPSRRFVYSASPDGRIHKLVVATGSEARSGRWPARITLNPRREKIGPALNYSRGLVLATTGGYVGDAPPYQGHAVTIAARTGRVLRVWNALCSNRHRLINPNTCSESGSAIWARSGVVVDPATGSFFVATGDGRFNGKTHWGDSVLLLSRKLRLLRNWTPTDANALESGDIDLGSTAPALIGRVFAVQGGKDGKLRLLSRRRLGGKLGRKGGELQTVSTPGGEGLFSAPAVSGNRVYVATGSGLWCYVLSRGRLRVAWRNGDSGTSPVLAGGLLYVYDAFGGGLRAYSPSTGRRLAGYRLPAGHWNSPIVTDGRIAVPTGDANEHRLSGSLYILSRT